MASWTTVWITGASSGIGLELARLLGRDVANVALSSRSADRLAEIGAEMASLKPYPLDVTDPRAVAQTVRRIEAEIGPIDLAVLNAGVWSPMEAAQFDLEAVRLAVDVNIMGVMNALGALLPAMIARRSGHIALVASVAGFRGLPRSLAYGPTKAALINLAETLNVELSPHGITVSVANPGFVDTPMTRGNEFAMPGMIPADAAARAFLKGLKAGRFEILFPRGFALGMRALKFLPNGLYFWLMRNTVWRRPAQARRSR